LTNTLALLAKKLIAEPEITQEAVQGVIKAKAQQALSDSLASIGISDSILGEKVGAGKVITDFASKLLPKVILDQTFISWLIIAFGGGSKSKPHTS
jgi:hypothetical protein